MPRIASSGLFGPATTLLAVPRSTDPRHGIWILPLVIVGMVGATAVFVNALSPGDVPEGTGTTLTGGGTAIPATTTSTTLGTTTTSTTLPPDVQAYLDVMSAVGDDANTLVERATTINQSWDDREISFQRALDDLRSLSGDTTTFVTSVEAATPTQLPLLEPAHLDVAFVARAMLSAAEAMVTGLQDPNSSEGRRVALEEYQAAGADLVAAVEVVGAVARGEDLSEANGGADPDNENLDITETDVGVDE